MKRTKRFLTSVLCAVFVLSAALGAAAQDITAKVTDNINGIIKIEGTAPGNAAGKKVNILVTNNNFTLQTAQANIEAGIQYQDSLLSGENGAFSKEFTLFFSEGADEEGTFTVYVGGEDFTAETIAAIPVYYASMGYKIKKADAICDAEVTAADELLESNKKVFAADNDLFNSLDKEKLAAFLKKALTDNSVVFLETTDENLEANTEIYVEFDELLSYSTIMEGFNQSKKQYLLDGNTIIHDEELSLTQYLKDKGTLYTLYSQKTDVAGVSNSINGLFGKNAQSRTELQRVFAKQVILNAITNNTTTGFGIVSDVLTDENIAAAGLSVPKYLALASTSAADDALYKIRKELTYSNLEEKIEECAETEVEVETPGTNINVSSRPTVNGSASSGGGGRSGSVSVQPAVTENTQTEQDAFTDLSSYDWAKEAITYLSEKNIINGVGNGAFNPGGSLTREAAAKIIMLAMGIQQENGETAFADVDGEMWYAPFVYTLNSQNIVNGISESEFGVGRKITREDFAVMIYRALGVNSQTGNTGFTDENAISSYAADAVSYLAGNGIINGYEDGSFGPKMYITRAEGAKIIYNILLK